MKINCDKQLLSAAINSVLLAVSAKSNLPSLEGILLRAQGGRLYLTGYDLELGISTSLEAQVEEEGEVVLSARLFSDMVKRMPADRIALCCDDKNLTEVKSGAAEYTILGIPARDFPELPAVQEGTPVSIPQNLLKSMIAQTLFAIAVSDSKPVHTGSLFDIAGGMVTLVSVDGYRLALRREKVDTPEELSFIVPGKTLSDLLRLLEDSDEPAGIQVSAKHIVFTLGQCSVVSRLLEGEFLDYKAAIPPQSRTTVEIDTRAFVDSIERTSLLISDRLKSPLRVTFDGGMIYLSCSTAIGKASDQLPCRMEGDPVEMGFNNRYLLDALKNADTDQVRLQLGGPLAPMKVLPPQGESFLFLVLPVRLKSEG